MLQSKNDKPREEVKESGEFQEKTLWHTFRAPTRTYVPPTPQMLAKDKAMPLREWIKIFGKGAIGLTLRRLGLGMNDTEQNVE